MNLIQSTYLQDEPIMHLSEPHLLAISKIAKPLVKLISGEGADELMGGYVRYKTLVPALLKSIATREFGSFEKIHYEKLIRYSQISKNLI
jgi:asparagine synthase (glutamine-hydrolysing)